MSDHEIRDAAFDDEFVDEIEKLDPPLQTSDDDRIPPAALTDDGRIPDRALCQEASSLSRDRYVPCLVPATMLVKHERDERPYFMCTPCATHNVMNRGFAVLAYRNATGSTTHVRDPQPRTLPRDAGDQRTAIRDFARSLNPRGGALRLGLADEPVVERRGRSDIWTRNDPDLIAEPVAPRSASLTTDATGTVVQTDDVESIANTVADTSTIALTQVETRVASKAATLADSVRALKATDGASYVQLCEQLKLVKALRRELEETFEPILAAQRKALEATRAAFRKHDVPLATAEDIGKAEIRRYDDAQAAAADAEQRRLEADELARAESRRLDDAFEAETAGDADTAAAILQQPLLTAPVVVPKQTPKVDGVVHRANWKGQCTNLEQLVLAAADELRAPDRTRPRLAFKLLQANAVEINRQAKSLKNELNKVPGIRAWDAGTTAIR